MFWNTTKIFEALATITANTKNHNAELQEFKGTFQRHIEKEDKEAGEINKKFEALQKCLSDKECPNFGDFKKIERRFYDSQKVHENRRISDKEIAAKEKTLEVKERATKDEAIATAISSLKTSRKYQWLTSSGIYIILGVILKKVFTSH
jgi:hypothetical protein